MLCPFFLLKTTLAIIYRLVHCNVDWSLDWSRLECRSIDAIQRRYRSLLRPVNNSKMIDMLSPFFVSRHVLNGTSHPLQPHGMAPRFLYRWQKNRSDSPFSPDELSFLAESDVASRVNGSPLSHSDRFSIVRQCRLPDISGIFRSKAFSGLTQWGRSLGLDPSRNWSIFVGTPSPSRDAPTALLT